ncbi:MAG: hypothetical protein LIO96_14835 [Lachnospiraceae bacterium]|nr:hypothetical protein [Lachnospiraceae bacterium]
MYISVDVDAGDGLSDGDIVTLDWNVNTSYLESALNAEFTYTEEEYTVNGLEEMESFDAFENITVEFSGMSPRATASIECSDPDLDSSYFDISPSGNLTIGDTVTVTISESSREQMIQELGKVPEETSREYTVESVAYYATTMDDIPEDALAKMQTQAEDAFTVNVVNSNYRDDTSLLSLTYLGCYFLSSKEMESWRHYNIIDLVYEVKINQSGSELTYYWFCQFINAEILDDGTFTMDYGDYDAPTGGLSVWVSCDLTSEDGTTHSYGGSADLDSLFNILVASKVDEYNYENTVEE